MTPEHQRRFMEELADFRGMDPLQPATWYELSAKDVLQRKVQKETRREQGGGGGEGQGEERETY